VVAPEPTPESREGVRLALRGDPLGVRGIEGEFEEHAVGVADIQRTAVAVLQHKGGRRRIARRLEATRDGETLLSILTNGPRQTASTACVSELYRKRWSLETAFKHIEAYFHSEINTLGYPKAALFGFCLALVAYNVLAVVMAALRGVHGQEKIDQDVSLYYVANAIATTSTGMMIAIPETEWGVCSMMSPSELAKTLIDLAQHVRLDAFRKSPTRARKSRSTPTRSPRRGMCRPPNCSRAIKPRRVHLEITGSGTYRYLN
jgi:Transposase DDE domain